MKILVIDVFGESVLDWCLRCRDAGHKVKLYIADRTKGEAVGRGLVERVADWQEWRKWADLVFLPDNIKFVKAMDAWRAQDKKIPIVCPTEETAAWETDRLLGQKVLGQHGIVTLPSREFTDYDEAIRHVKRTGQTICKPCGEETDKALSFVGKSPASMVSKLELWKSQGKLKGSFLIQEKIDGVEMGVGAWFSPRSGFTGGWEENWEHKGLFPGNRGPATGEMGTVMRFVRQSRLAKIMLKPLENTLASKGYFGNIDVNCIIDREGNPWPLEFTMRPGWPAYAIQMALQEGDPAEWLIDLWEGRNLQCFRVDEIAVGVVLVIPPYPYSHEVREEVIGIPIYNADGNNIHLCMVMEKSNPHDVDGKVVMAPGLATAGSYVMVVTGTGSTVKAARRMAYKSLDRIDIPAKPYFRDDIGEKLMKDIPIMAEHGYARGLEY